jgi:PKD repeat protein
VTAQRIFADNGTFIVGLQVTDSGGLSAIDAVTVTVTNVSPTVTAITAPLSPVQLGTTVNVSAAFTDPGTEDNFTVVWTWDDGTTSGGTVSSHIVSGTHLYAVPGVYTVRLTVTDDDGGAGTLTYQYVVVYDPTGGFVTGGGWFTDPASGSKIHFGFNPKYQPNSTLLKGETEFKLSGITFKSTSHEWLVINGAKAQFKGSGTVNGAGDYGFLVTVIDGTPDKIRIKIWDKATGEEFYDNQPDAPDYADPVIEIGGGSIQVHAK